MQSNIKIIAGKSVVKSQCLNTFNMNSDKRFYRWVKDKTKIRRGMDSSHFLSKMHVDCPEYFWFLYLPVEIKGCTASFKVALNVCCVKCID